MTCQCGENVHDYNNSNKNIINNISYDKYIWMDNNNNSGSNSGGGHNNRPKNGSNAFLAGIPIYK